MTALLELVLPLGLYYALRAAGVDVYLTLVLAAVIPAVLIGYRLLRRRRLDGLGVFVLSTMLLSTAVSLISGSPQLLLAREGWLTGFTSLWFLASAPSRRPLAYLYSRPMLQKRFGPPGVPWDELWDRLPAFRRIWRISTVLWGLGLLADSVVRVVMAYTLPADVVPALGTALYVVTSAVLIVGTNVYYILGGLYNTNSALYRPLDLQAVSSEARR